MKDILHMIDMKREKTVLFSAFVLMIMTSVSAIGPSDYKGDLQVDVQSESVSPGEEIEADLSVSNDGDRPIVDGYIVVNVVRGGTPYYPTQGSDKNNVFHEDKIEGIHLKSGNVKDFEYNYELPENLRPGNYRIDGYFKTERSPINGYPHIYSAPTYENFSVTGSSGSYPGLDISRTETYFTGIDEVVGDWDPDRIKFNGTKWPSLTGPVGVLTTGSMETVEGEVFINNPSGSSKSATLDITVCEWDDTSCYNQVDKLSKSVDVPASGTSVPVEVENPADPSAYAIKMKLTANGETHSLYRNRIIRGGNTSRIRKLSVNQPYIPEGDELSVGLVASASADHYTNPTAEGVKAEVTVTQDGNEIFSKTKDINRLSNANTFEKLYFNSTVDSSLTKYTVSSELSADGEVFDSHSYEVDYTKFENSIKNISLESYSFDDSTFDVELCGESESGAPGVGQVQVLLKESIAVDGKTSGPLEGCGSLTVEDIEAGNYEMVVNYGDQSIYNVSASSSDSDGNGVQEGGDGESGDSGGLPIIPIAAIGLLITVIGVVYYFVGGSQ